METKEEGLALIFTRLLGPVAVDSSFLRNQKPPVWF